MLECLIDGATWKKLFSPMWASVSILFVVHHFKMILFTCGMGLCLSNCPTHKRSGLPFSTHTHKSKTKRIIKITNPKNSIEKTQKKGKKKTNNKKKR
jgi:hypothetical protein